ncbi:hypothetical protein QE442_003479 [Chryseobacterium sp. SORGH_AS1175]|nr:hypothetical protein [Chryseobacterium sp. SORGH_AS_1175]
MLRIYCDKNIYSSIKEGKRNFNPELKELMDELNEILIFTYILTHTIKIYQTRTVLFGKRIYCY